MANTIPVDLDWIQLRKEMDQVAGDSTDKSYSSILINRCKEAPYVPLGCFVTVGVFIRGLVYFAKGDRWGSQRMMRARCVAQGVTIALALFSMKKGVETLRDDEEDD